MFSYCYAYATLTNGYANFKASHRQPDSVPSAFTYNSTHKISCEVTDRSTDDVSGTITYYSTYPFTHQGPNRVANAISSAVANSSPHTVPCRVSN
jgi:hypothetical protein